MSVVVPLRPTRPRPALVRRPAGLLTPSPEPSGDPARSFPSPLMPAEQLRRAARLPRALGQRVTVAALEAASMELETLQVASGLGWA